MSTPSVAVPARRRRWGWVAGVLTFLLLAAFGILLGAPSTATTLPKTQASGFVPADATRGKVTLHVGNAEVPAELSDARLVATAVPAAISATAYDAIPMPTRAESGTSWIREAVVPVDGSLPTRFRLRAVDDQGVHLVVQEWGDLGLVLDGFLELPADVSAGRSWASSGTARSLPADGDLRFTNASTSSTPDDAARAAEGCLSVVSRTQLTGRESSTWTETELWCPGKGVVAGEGEQQGTTYAVVSGGAPSPVTDDELVEAPWDPTNLDRWELQTRAVVAGDATFGLVDASNTGAVDPGRPPVVAASGVVVFPTLEGGDLVGLVDRGPGLWAHWWARPGGQVTTLATDGSLVLAPTTAHRLSAYRAGRTLAWNAALDDVAVAPPLPVGDAVAVATVSGRLTLLDARTGGERWSVPVGGGVHTALAGGDGLVVTADTGSTVTAWDVTTGQQRWQVGDAADPYTTTPQVTGGSVVVASAGTLTAYAADSGRRTWVREAGLGLGSVAAVGDQLWLGVGSDLQAWSAADGTRLWTLPGAQPVTTPASGCGTPAGTALGLARRGDELVAVDGGGAVRASWALPGVESDVLTATCRAAGVDLTAYAPDGSRPLRVFRLAAP